MSYTLAAATAILKEIVLPEAREQLNNSSPYLKLIQKGAKNAEADQVKLSLHVTRNSGIGARIEADSSPSAGRQGFVKAAFPFRKQVGRIQLTLEAMKAMKSSASSVETPYVTETKRVVNDISRDMNRQLWGTADGVIANCGVTTAANIVVLTTPTTVQMNQFEVGMLVDIGTVANPTSIAQARSITGVSAANGTITIGGAVVTTTAAAFVFRSGNGGATGGFGQREFTGNQAIVKSSGVLFGVDPATYPMWASTYDTSGGNRTPTEAVLQKPMDNVQIASGQTLKTIFTTHGVFRAFGATLTSSKRFNDTTELHGGVSGLMVASATGQATLVVDRDAPSNTAYGINLDHQGIAEWDGGLNWMDDDGAILSRVTGQTAYEATIVYLAEQWTDQRNSHCVIDKLTEA